MEDVKDYLSDSQTVLNQSQLEEVLRIYTEKRIVDVESIKKREEAVCGRANSEVLQQQGVLFPSMPCVRQCCSSRLRKVPQSYCITLQQDAQRTG